MFALEQHRFSVTPGPIRLGLVHLSRKRPWPSCLNPDTGREWWEDMKEKILATLDAAGGDLAVVRTDLGGDRVDDDSSLRAALEACQKEKVDVVLAIQPVISDGRLAPVLAQQWGHPVVFWATPEEQTGEMISANSLVGTHLMASNLRQLGFPAQVVYGNLDWKLAEEQLGRAIRVAFTVRYLQKAKLGLIGYQAPGNMTAKMNQYDNLNLLQVSKTSTPTCPV